MSKILKFFALGMVLLFVAGALFVAWYLFVGREAAIAEPHPVAKSVTDTSKIVSAPLTDEDIAAGATTIDAVPAEIVAAKDELRAEYAKKKDSIPEEVAKPLDDDIGVIEGAAADLLAAIANEPDNENLKLMLVQTYRNEMKLLKKALHLSGAEDEEQLDEAVTTPAN